MLIWPWSFGYSGATWWGRNPIHPLAAGSDIWGLFRTFICGVKDVSPVKMAALRRLIGLVPGMVQCARQGGRAKSEYTFIDRDRNMMFVLLLTYFYNIKLMKTTCSRD